MKTIHFYGCSLTAGDELSDYEYPELSNHATQETYWPARQEFMKDRQKSDEYLEKNKQKAYPAKVAAKGFKTTNFAENGASLEEMIYKIMLNLSDIHTPMPDAVFLQVPPTQREAVFINEYPYVNTIRYNDLMPERQKNNKYHDYITSKIMSFNDAHFAISDIMKLYSLKYFLDAKNIPFYLIEMTDDLSLRYSFVESDMYNNIVNILKDIPILDIFPITRTMENSVCLAGHFTEKMHEIIANMIVETLS
jgi:hypothetical protein